MHAACRPHLFLFHLITLIIGCSVKGTDYDTSHYAVFSSLQLPHFIYFVQILFLAPSYKKSLMFPWAWDEVWHPYKTAGKITERFILYDFI
jgi:hypothetical protein